MGEDINASNGFDSEDTVQGYPQARWLRLAIDAGVVTVRFSVTIGLRW